MEAFKVWTLKAMCRTRQDLDFYTEQSARWIEENLPCGACPVRQDCDDYAIVYDEDGIWGGRSKYMRNRQASSKWGAGITYRDSLTRQAINRGLLEINRVPRNQVLQDYLLTQVAKNFRLNNPTHSVDLRSLLQKVLELDRELEQVLPLVPHDIPIAPQEAYLESTLDQWLRELDSYIQSSIL